MKPWKNRWFKEWLTYTQTRIGLLVNGWVPGAPKMDRMCVDDYGSHNGSLCKARGSFGGWRFIRGVFVCVERSCSLTCVSEFVWTEPKGQHIWKRWSRPQLRLLFGCTVSLKTHRSSVYDISNVTLHRFLCGIVDVYYNSNFNRFNESM